MSSRSLGRRVSGGRNSGSDGEPTRRPVRGSGRGRGRGRGRSAGAGRGRSPGGSARRIKSPRAKSSGTPGSSRKLATGRSRRKMDGPLSLHDITRSGHLFLKSVGRFAGRPWVSHLFTLKDQRLYSDDGQVVIPIMDAQVFRPAHPKYDGCIQIRTPQAMVYLLRADTCSEADDWAADLAIHTGRTAALQSSMRSPGHVGPVSEQSLPEPEDDPSFIKKVAGELKVKENGLMLGHPWRKRFAMIQQGYFCVAPHSKAKHFQMVLPMLNCVARVMDHHKHDHVMQVFFPGTGLLMFQCLDDEDRKEWVDSINKVVRLLHSMQGLPLPPGAPPPPARELAAAAAKAAVNGLAMGATNPYGITQPVQPAAPVVARNPAPSPQNDVRRGVSAIRPSKSSGGGSGAGGGGGVGSDGYDTEPSDDGRHPDIDAGARVGSSRQLVGDAGGGGGGVDDGSGDDSSSGDDVDVEEEELADVGPGADVVVPSQCSLRGSGLTRAMRGKDAAFEVVLRDEYGDLVTDAGNCVNVSLTGGEVIDVTNHLDGTYGVVYRPAAKRPRRKKNQPLTSTGVVIWIHVCGRPLPASPLSPMLISAPKKNRRRPGNGTGTDTGASPSPRKPQRGQGRRGPPTTPAFDDDEDDGSSSAAAGTPRSSATPGQRRGVSPPRGPVGTPTSSGGGAAAPRVPPPSAASSASMQEISAAVQSAADAVGRLDLHGRTRSSSPASNASGAGPLPLPPAPWASAAEFQAFERTERGELDLLMTRLARKYKDGGDDGSAPAGWRAALRGWHAGATVPELQILSTAIRNSGMAEKDIVCNRLGRLMTAKTALQAARSQSRRRGSLSSTGSGASGAPDSPRVSGGGQPAASPSSSHSSKLAARQARRAHGASASASASPAAAATPAQPARRDTPPVSRDARDRVSTRDMRRRIGAAPSPRRGDSDGDGDSGVGGGRGRSPTPLPQALSAGGGGGGGGGGGTATTREVLITATFRRDPLGFRLRATSGGVGACVQGVQEGSEAAEAGVQRHDVLRTVDDVDASAMSFEQILMLVQITTMAVRGGEAKQLTFARTVTDGEDRAAARTAVPASGSGGAIGNDASGAGRSGSRGASSHARSRSRGDAGTPRSAGRRGLRGKGSMKLQHRVLGPVRQRLRAAAYGPGGLDYGKLFRHYDRDNSGLLEVDEFRRALRKDAKLSPNDVTDGEILDMFNDCDADGSGTIDVAEFVEWLEAGATHGDSDSTAALKLAATDQVVKATRKHMARRMSTSSDGSSVPSHTIRRRGRRQHRIDHGAAAGRLASRMVAVRQRLRAAAYTVGGLDYGKLFRHYDRDNSGLLEVDEFRRALRKDAKLSAEVVTDGEILDMFNDADADGSGSIDVAEFVEWLQQDAHNEENTAALKLAASQQVAQATRKHMARRMSDASASQPGYVSQHLKRRGTRGSVTSVTSESTAGGAGPSGAGAASNHSPSAGAKAMLARMLAPVRAKLRAAAYTAGGVDFATLFRHYDRDNSGGLTFDEFLAALRKDAKVTSRDVSDAEAELVFRAADRDGDGAFDVDEFVAFVLGSPEAHAAAAAAAAPSASRGSGYASRARERGRDRAPRGRRARARSKASAKQQQQQASSRRRKGGRRRGVDRGFVASVRAKLRAAAYRAGGVDYATLFRHYDRDNSGELEFDEFRSALRRDAKVTQDHMTDRDLLRLFNVVDADCSGAVDIDEFASWLAGEATGTTTAGDSEATSAVVTTDAAAGTAAGTNDGDDNDDDASSCGSSDGDTDGAGDGEDARGLTLEDAVATATAHGMPDPRRASVMLHLALPSDVADGTDGGRPSAVPAADSDATALMAEQSRQMVLQAEQEQQQQQQQEEQQQQAVEAAAEAVEAVGMAPAHGMARPSLTPVREAPTPSPSPPPSLQPADPATPAVADTIAAAATADASATPVVVADTGAARRPRKSSGKRRAKGKAKKVKQSPASPAKASPAKTTRGMGSTQPARLSQYPPTQAEVQRAIATYAGRRVRLAKGGTGVVRFAGRTRFAGGVWLGIELDEPAGKNDGSVAGTRYFTCEHTPPSDGHFGLFVRCGAVAAVQPATGDGIVHMAGGEPLDGPAEPTTLRPPSPPTTAPATTTAVASAAPPGVPRSRRAVTTARRRVASAKAAAASSDATPTPPAAAHKGPRRVDSGPHKPVGSTQGHMSKAQERQAALRRRLFARRGGAGDSDGDAGSPASSSAAADAGPAALPSNSDLLGMLMEELSKLEAALASGQPMAVLLQRFRDIQGFATAAGLGSHLDPFTASGSALGDAIKRHQQAPTTAVAPAEPAAEPVSPAPRPADAARLPQPVPSPQTPATQPAPSPRTGFDRRIAVWLKALHLPQYVESYRAAGVNTLEQVAALSHADVAAMDGMRRTDVTLLVEAAAALGRKLAAHAARPAAGAATTTTTTAAAGSTSSGAPGAVASRRGGGVSRPASSSAPSTGSTGRAPDSVSSDHSGRSSRPDAGTGADAGGRRRSDSTSSAGGGVDGSSGTPRHLLQRPLGPLSARMVDALLGPPPPAIDLGDGAAAALSLATPKSLPPDMDEEGEAPAGVLEAPTPQRHVRVEDGAAVPSPVGVWLQSLHLGRYAGLFAKAGYTELSQLAMVDKEALQELGVVSEDHRPLLRAAAVLRIADVQALLTQVKAMPHEASAAAQAPGAVTSQ